MFCGTVLARRRPSRPNVLCGQLVVAGIAAAYYSPLDMIDAGPIYRLESLLDSQRVSSHSVIYKLTQASHTASHL